MKWEIISSEYLCSHPPYFIARKDVCKRPDGNIIPAYYVVELPPSVIVVPVVNDEVLMIRQYRHPVGEVSWEFPGGFVDEGEDSLQAAVRELKEETGFSFRSYTYLGKIAGNPGILNNYTHIYLAEEKLNAGATGFDANEDIVAEWFSIAEIQMMLTQDKIIQSLHANACYRAFLKMGKLQFS